MVISIMMSIFGLRIKEDRMKKAIKKTCVVLLLFALLVSQVAASYSETGTLSQPLHTGHGLLADILGII